MKCLMVPYQTLEVMNTIDHLKGSHSSFCQLTQHFTVYLQSVSLCKKGIMYFTLKTSEIDNFSSSNSWPTAHYFDRNDKMRHMENLSTNFNVILATHCD